MIDDRDTSDPAGEYFDQSRWQPVRAAVVERMKRELCERYSADEFARLEEVAHRVGWARAYGEAEVILGRR